MGRFAGCHWVYGGVTFITSLLPKNLHYLITGEDALACPPQQKCSREEQKGDSHWDQLQPRTRPAVEISPARHEEDVRVVER